MLASSFDLKKQIFFPIFVFGLFPDMLVLKNIQLFCFLSWFPAFNMVRNHLIHFNHDMSAVKAPGTSYFHNSS